MKKCPDWRKDERIIGWNGIEPIHSIKQICLRAIARKEPREEPYTCEGEISKCDYYLNYCNNIKNKKTKINTLEMMIVAKETGKTYKYGDIRYNNFHGFYDINGYLLDEHIFTYEFKDLNDIFKIDGWELVVDEEMTKEEAETKFNIKIVGN